MTPPPSHSPREITALSDGWAFTPGDLPANSTWDDVLAAGEAVTVPHTWNAVDGSAGGNYRRGRGTYARQISAQPNFAETWIHFDGVNSWPRFTSTDTRLPATMAGTPPFAQT